MIFKKTVKKNVSKRKFKTCFHFVNLILLLILFRTGVAADNYFQFTKFTAAYLPEGICCDEAGDVFVASVDSNNVFQELLTKYSPNAAVLNQTVFSQTGMMRYDNSLQKIWMLIDKQFFLIDPADLSFTNSIDISSLTINTNQIYDIATGYAFPTALDPNVAKYGDFDLYYRGNQLDIFVAGFNQSWHFILRIRLLNQVVQSARVIVTSGASLSPEDNSPHGVAVNSQGIVLTTLGWAGPAASVDQPVTFGADYPENQNQVPVYLFDAYQSFSSRGMTCDQNDNFYVATGWTGGGAAGGGNSCMIVVPAALDTTKVFALQSLFANPRDVAIDYANGKVYLTDADTDYFGDNDAVWVMPLGAIGNVEEPQPVLSYELLQNYPNPFNPVTTIQYHLPSSEVVQLGLYNILGQKVADLINKRQPAGIHTVEFDGSDLAAGIYFYRLQAGKFSDVKKLILLK